MRLEEYFFLITLIVALFCFMWKLLQKPDEISSQQIAKLASDLLILQEKVEPELQQLGERVSKLEDSLKEALNEVRKAVEETKNNANKSAIARLIKEAKELKTLHDELRPTFHHLEQFGLIELPHIWFAELPVDKIFIKDRLRRRRIPNVTFYRIEQHADNHRMGDLTLLPDAQTLAIVLNEMETYGGACTLKGKGNFNRTTVKQIHAGKVELDEHSHWKVTKKIEIEY